jgi:hypothetical protein
MGFRDIELFNLSLLARQAWRILQDPNTLSARILKAIYFPSGDFLDARIESSPSRVWRAIMEGKDVLKQGLVRRIGNGKTTHVWNMNWIPRDGLLRPIPTNHEEPPQLVSELIDAQTRSWDMEKLQEFMLPMDQEVIRNILLPSRRQEDHWAWHYDKKGIFLVCSAYRMLVSTKETRTTWLEGSVGVSGVKKVEKEWLALWHVRVPSKLRVFLWRLGKQSLPTTDVLHHRNMATQMACALCGSLDSWRHSLLECNMARSIWALLPDEIVELIINTQEPDARS